MSSPVDRPPESGPGSGVTAWRDYAASVTGDPVAEFDDMSRDEIIEYLGSSDAESASISDEPASFGDEAGDVPASAPETGGWMVPTDKGWEAE